MMYRGRSGISPVVATVILVAIAIVIAIAVAFWATGLVGIFTRFEKLEITSAYQNPDPQKSGEIVVRVRNTGSSPTSITEVIINGVKVKEVDTPETCKLDVGQSLEVTIKTDGLQGGVTYEVILKSAGGKQYPTAVLAHSGTRTQGGVPDIQSVSCQAPTGGTGGGGNQTGGGSNTGTSQTTSSETTGTPTNASSP